MGHFIPISLLSIDYLSLLLLTMSDISAYLSYRNFIKRILTIAGIWPTNKPSILYRLFPYIHVTLACYSVFGIIGFIQFHFTRVNLVTKGISVIVGIVGSLLKTVSVMVYRRDLEKVHRLLDEHFLKLLKNPKLSSIVLNDLTTVQRLSKILSYLLILSCITYVTTPMGMIIYQMYHAQPVKYLLPIPAVYPWSVSPLIYKLQYIVDSLSLTTNILVGCGMDMMLPLNVVLIGGQLRELSYKITNINDNPKKILRECILQHEILQECTQIIQNSLEIPILWTIVTNAISLCSQMFQFTQMMNLSIGRTILFSMYLLYKLVQTYLLSYAGSFISAESEKYAASIYSSKWYCYDKKLMSSILIMLSVKPLTVRAWKFSTLSLDIFATVLNTAFSYFFMLQAVHNH